MLTVKLLNKVLNEEASEVQVDKDSVNYLVKYDFIEDSWYSINIYELLHKCKNWIKEQGFCIRILDRNNGLLDLTLTYGIEFDYTKQFSYKTGIHGELPQEIGAVLNAAQWVLTYKGN